jgi:two-component system response regulator FixJ
MIPIRPAHRKPVTVHEEADAARCARGRVVLIDDDQHILASLKTLVELSGFMGETYATAEEFLASLARAEPVYPGPSCVVSDVKMPDIDGLELLSRLTGQDALPLILISGGSGISEAIEAFHLGVVDFLVKPFEMEAFLAAIEKGLAISARQQAHKREEAELLGRASALTPREREVAGLVAMGQRNREIAGKLAISERMVKMHRQSAMEKLNARNTAEFVRIVDRAGLA